MSRNRGSVGRKEKKNSSSLLSRATDLFIDSFRLQQLLLFGSDPVDRHSPIRRNGNRAGCHNTEKTSNAPCRVFCIFNDFYTWIGSIAKSAALRYCTDSSLHSSSLTVHFAYMSPASSNELRNVEPNLSRSDPICSPVVVIFGCSCTCSPFFIWKNNSQMIGKPNRTWTTLRATFAYYRLLIWRGIIAKMIGEIGDVGAAKGRRTSRPSCVMEWQRNHISGSGLCQRQGVGGL